MDSYLWKIRKEKLANTNLYLYSQFIKENYQVDGEGDFNKIWKWSVDKPQFFWKSTLEVLLHK